MKSQNAEMAFARKAGTSNGQNSEQASPARAVKRVVSGPGAPRVLIELDPEVSETAVTAFCILHLKERGYHVSSPNEKWETITDFRRRLGIHSETVRKALADPLCPQVQVHRGEKRIIELVSNPAFESFCLRNKR